MHLFSPPSLILFFLSLQTFLSSSYIYVANFDDNTVSVIQTSENEVITTIPITPDNPGGVSVLSPSGSYTYVMGTGHI
jgi:YVTN family beta-propeller protein